MKKIGFVLLMAISMTLASCSMLGGAGSSSNNAATSSAVTGGVATPQQAGSTCGQSLIALYNSKQANGKIAITNANDVTNILSLINCYNALRSNKDDADYKKQFTTGLISAGGNLITAQNATSIVNSLLNTTGISSNFNSANVSEKMQTITAIMQLINALKQ